MNKQINYALKYLNIFIAVLIVINIVNVGRNIKKIEDDSIYITASSIGVLPTTPRYIAEEEITEVQEEKENEKIVSYDNTYKNTDVIPVLKTYTGNISHYGPDCDGCSGITASGYNVKNGNIYYNDSTYGKVRIVASDSSIPFGTIVRMNIKGESVLAIVLDRGGIGFGKKYLFDLLCASEEDSYKFGVLRNTEIDVLRIGY